MAARLILSGSKDKNHRWTAMKGREPTRPRNLPIFLPMSACPRPDQTPAKPSVELLILGRRYTTISRYAPAKPQMRSDAPISSLDMIFHLHIP